MTITLAVTLVFVMLSACQQPAPTADNIIITSIHDIPGITEIEIDAIEELREKRDFFVYGMNPSTEAFVDANGDIRGFGALMCQWLYELFDIPFVPALYDWNDLMSGLENHDIDFTGELTPTEERRKTFFMTDAIAGRSVKYMRIVGKPTLMSIAEIRTPRCAFLQRTVTYDEVRAHLGDTVEYFHVDSYEEAYRMLINGEIDFFFEDSSAEAAFDISGDVVAVDFFPLIYGPVSLTTLNPANEPIISVVQKALKSGALRHLSYLYNLGENEYSRHKFVTSLTEDEIQYLLHNPVVNFVAEYDNYPVSFYNTREGEWQGIFFDVLAELENLTGLRFEHLADELVSWPDLLRMLETGEASVISELIRTPDREDRFLWPDTPLFRDYYALLSKSEHHRMSIGEVWLARVGIVEDTAHAELFSKWFMNHSYTTLYTNSDNAFNALQRGDIDMVMASRNQLLVLTHYQELAGYKSNIVFSYPLLSTLGFNLDEAILCSIIDKALRLVDTSGVTDDWLDRTYDYRQQIAETRQPWFIGVIVLLVCLVCFLVVMIALFYRSRRTERLAMEVQIREQELVADNDMLDQLNRMKNEFFQNMSHYFKTTLTVISGRVLDTLDMIDFEMDFGMLKENMEIAQKETMRMGRMVDSARRQAAMYSSEQDMKPLDIAALLREGAETYRVLLERNGNTLSVDVPATLPQVSGNTDMLLLILSNLISNANRYTKSGTIIISAEDHGNMVAVKVSDNGTGISADVIPNVFERGVSDSGSGLGLPICKSAVEAHGGTITVDSKTGQGTSVMFTIPVCKGEHEDDR